MNPRQLRGNKWAKTGIEQRRHPRKPPSVIPHLKAVRIVAGPEAKLVNISRSGALIETGARLATKSNICLRVVTAEAILMLRGKIVYSRAAALASSGILFHTAVEFDEDFPLVDADLSSDKASTGNMDSVTFREPSEPVLQPAPTPATAEEPGSVVVVTAESPGSGKELGDIFELNNW